MPHSKVTVMMANNRKPTRKGLTSFLIIEMKGMLEKKL